MFKHYDADHHSTLIHTVVALPTSDMVLVVISADTGPGA